MRLLYTLLFNKIQWYTLIKLIMYIKFVDNIKIKNTICYILKDIMENI